MRTLLTGADGYVGSLVVNKLKNKFDLIGLDIGYFQNLFFLQNALGLDKGPRFLKEDIRYLSFDSLPKFKNVVHLAAISNDPMGEKFSSVTYKINLDSTVRLAKLSKEAGVSRFIFASSASVYGASDEVICSENTKANPLTAYSKSKYQSEIELQKLASDKFNVYCFRFATACGYSPKLRMDLVLNELVYQAVVHGKIKLNSMGTAFRPLIDTNSMVDAIEWGLTSKPFSKFEIINIGFESWNFRIIDLAELVTSIIPNSSIEVNKDGVVDKRTYKLDFSKSKKLGIFDKVPKIEDTIVNLRLSYESFIKSKPDFDFNNFKRLTYLEKLIEYSILNENLDFINQK